MNKQLEPVKGVRDETHLKLIEAAGEVFAEVGYQAATVRDICARAGVNVAAVNYHFRDKLGLYTEILKNAVGTAGSASVRASAGSNTPEEGLRLFLTEMLQQLNRDDRPAWKTKVMAHEMARPTSVLAVVVEHIIQPTSLVLCDIVGRIIDRPPLDLQTRLCTHSIIGQFVHYIHARPVIGLLWPEWEMTPEAIEKIIDHVTEFSLAGLKAIKAKNARVATKQVATRHLATKHVARKKRGSK